MVVVILVEVVRVSAVVVVVIAVVEVPVMAVIVRVLVIAVVEQSLVTAAGRHEVEKSCKSVESQVIGTHAREKSASHP